MDQARILGPLAVRGRLSDYLELTKPRVASLVLVTTAAGFYLASPGSLDWLLLLHALFGTGLVAGGTAVLNQYLEREQDGLMRRTAKRPIPSGRLQPRSALSFGLFLVLGGSLYLILAVNILTAVLGGLTASLYLLLYTPLKTRTPFCTTIGALPGALPPVMGWAAARGTLDAGAWFLFAILFLWQYPHFLSIAWIYREDYERGGFRMLPVLDRDGKFTALQVMMFSLALGVVSLMPAINGTAGLLYAGAAVLLGCSLLGVSLSLALSRSRQGARRLLRFSVFHLPVLLLLLVVDRV